jgi:hypothetical protein
MSSWATHSADSARISFGRLPGCQEGEEVALVGGGNSAGRAVVFLAPKVKRLHIVVRGPGLEASMSRYLIDRIAALPNVELHTETEVVGLEGDESTGLSLWLRLGAISSRAYLLYRWTLQRLRSQPSSCPFRLRPLPAAFPL